MKKAIRIIIPFMLALAIVLCTGWYLLVYDRDFTRDILLNAARYFEENGNHTVSAWFYGNAYKQGVDNESVAVEMAEQYISAGNYTKAEYTLSNAIADGGGVELYIALCKTYVAQDKLLDAVNMLNNVTNKDIKAQLDMLRPDTPTCSPDPTSTGAYYSQYITVTVSSQRGTLYVNSNGEVPSIKKDRYQKGITLHDGENIIYAISVADNGLVSPAAVFGFTVGGVIKEVAFADAAMENALRELIGVSKEKLLYNNDLWGIKEFTVPEGVKNLDDLQHLAFLEKLTISKSVSGQLRFISGLSNLKELSITDTIVTAEELPLIGRLPHLEKLKLSGCSLSTTTGLEQATHLTHLNLSNNAIRNIDALSGMQNLQELNLSQNALNDLSAISSLAALTGVNVSFNNLSTLSPLTYIAGLKRLEAANNAVSALEDFMKLTALEYLDVSYNNLADILPLTACTNLQTLNVSNNKLTDINTLVGMNKLADLNFSHNKVSALPKWSKDCALVNIDGSYNQIKYLEPLAGLKLLNNVLMDYNQNISSVKELASCPRLIQVNVYGTKVRDVGALTSQSIVVNYNPT